MSPARYKLSDLEIRLASDSISVVYLERCIPSFPPRNSQPQLESDLTFTEFFLSDGAVSFSPLIFYLTTDCLMATPPLLLLLFALSVALSSPVLKPSSIVVQIAGDNQGNFHLGGHDRTNFELVEQFQPLARAYSHSTHKKIKYVYKPYIPPKPSSISPVTVPVPVLESPVIESTTSASVTSPMAQPAENSEKKDGEAKSQWQSWTSWTPCRGGERKRVRGCLKLSEDDCEGSSVEKQKCYLSHHQSPIKFARNPWTIEREISRAEPEP
ncbi:hypothetical protein QR680_006025 [Steinernema hermaphroditum]|uniref:Uncharacterized protein n=1 Tax=Steinernema hermaphroditum TaxID=289476 RepID=A0AA39HVD7_9BILA|nr:hypothetical protein QR680_006025 [Steinernema hermaphroditum]